MSKRAIIVTSKKGGVGKSTTAKALIDLTRASGRSVAAWDLDGQTGSLAFVYPPGDPLTGVGTEDIRDPRAPGAWLESFHSDADDVIVDVPGGALDSLLGTFSGGSAALVKEIRSSGRELVVVSVLGHKKDATATAQEAVEIFGKDARHVVVLNGFFGSQADFIVYYGFQGPDGTSRFGQTAKMVESVGGETVFLPRMNAQADVLLDLESMSMANGSTAIAALGRKHSGNIRYWLDEVADAFKGTWLDVNGNVPQNVKRKAAAAVNG